MKRMNFIKSFTFALSFLAFIACELPTNSSGSDVSVLSNDSATDTIPAADTSGNTDTEAERSKVIDDDFTRGFDASYVDYFETDKGYKYYDTDGTETDFFQILKNHSFDTVRLRIWVDPENAEANGVVSGDDSWANSGMNTLERTIRLAKRAKEAGLKVSLDFHYSDYWTDPGKQVIPYSWQSITTASEMAATLAEYTKDVLNKMKDENVLPDFVQVGNEIDSGVLCHTKFASGMVTTADDAVSGKRDSDNFVAYLKAGCDAVREVSKDIKIILHVTNSKPTTVLTKEISAQLDYDIVGLSYYSWESSHGTITSLRNNIKTFRGADYGNKAVMVVESSMYWNYGDYDANKKDLKNSAEHMIDPSTGKIYNDLTTKEVTYSGSTVTIVEGSIANQANTFRHIIKEAADCGASGMFAWGGDLRGEWKYAFFSDGGKAFASIDAFRFEVEISDDTSGEREDDVVDEGTAENLPYEANFIATGGCDQFLSIATFKSLTISSITVAVSDCDWSNCAEDWRWLNVYSDSNWGNKKTFFDYDVGGTEQTSGSVTISDADVISSIKTNGLFLGGLKGLSCNIKVSAE